MFKGLQTVPEAIAALEQAVKIMGETYKYDADKLGNTNGECQYAYEEDGVVKPGCIVGYAVFVTEGQEALEQLHEVGDPGTYSMHDIAEFEDIPSGVVQVLAAAQSRQDEREEWGWALAVAKRRAGELGAQPIG